MTSAILDKKIVQLLLASGHQGIGAAVSRLLQKKA